MEGKINESERQEDTKTLGEVVQWFQNMAGKIAFANLDKNELETLLSTLKGIGDNYEQFIDFLQKKN